MVAGESKTHGADHRSMLVPRLLPESVEVRDHRIRIVLERLLEGWSAGVSLSALSAVANLSERHLSTFFKREVGIALREYLQALRMAKAADMLRSTALSVKEVACAVGCSATSNFDREFKRVYGVRPSEYRNRAKEGGPAAPRARHTRTHTNFAAVDRGYSLMAAGRIAAPRK